MTPTPYTEIFDLVMMSLTSYELDSLLAKLDEDPSDDSGLVYLTGFLVNAIPNFENCIKNLSDRNDDNMTFNIELDDDEKNILACWTTIQVLKKEIFDIRQIRGMIQNGSDANRYSEANLLKEKQNHCSVLMEDADLKQTRYGIKHHDWESLYGTN
jgi:hypothetical protein